ncbi:MAG: hypothetical protein CLLPBCKN_007278 [Chroococcidiopsis cubana SAG 39.79]|nr:hypothetical protein [Chroococcidiopsis cubana SAG 39.79]
MYSLLQKLKQRLKKLKFLLIWLKEKALNIFQLKTEND